MTPPTTTSGKALATILAEALRTHQTIAPPWALVPHDRNGAYIIQKNILQQLNSPVGAWKVGTAAARGEVLGSPIPEHCIQKAPGTVRLCDFAVCGLELELAFRFNCSFPGRDVPYSDGEVLNALEAVAPAIEVVSSRFQGWPDLPEFLKLADLQNHGALIIGATVPYYHDFPFETPLLQLTVNGIDRAKCPAGNPAGDPRLLLPAFVRQCAQRGLPVEAGHWVTTGSYSGVYFADASGQVIGTFEGMPEVRLQLA